MADAEHGTQGEADGARGEAGGGNRALTPTRTGKLVALSDGVRHDASSEALVRILVSSLSGTQEPDQPEIAECQFLCDDELA